MSIKIPLNQLSANQKIIIREKLYLKPIVQYRPNNFYTQTKTVDNVQFFFTDEKYVYLPLAIGVQIVEQLTTPYHYEYKHLKCPLEFNNEYTLRPHQVDIIKWATQALSANIHGGLGIGIHIGARPGAGKTLMAIYLACTFKLLTIIFITKVDTELDQWLKSFKKLTNGKIWIVGKAFPKLIDDEYISVILCMNGRFHHIPKELIPFIGMVIVDEAHNLCTANNVPVLLGVQPRYFISLSATIKRTNGLHSMILNIVGDNQLYMKNDQQFDYIEVKTCIQIPIYKQTDGKTTDFIRLVRDLSIYKPRNILILEMVRAMTHDKILILTDRYDHADYLYRCLGALKENVDMFAGAKKSYSNSRVLVGTYKKIAEAFDEENKCPDWDEIRLNTLFNCMTYKSERLVAQTIGRVLRSDNPKVFDFHDDMTICNNHFNIRKKWAVNNCGIYKYIDIDWNDVSSEIAKVIPPYILRETVKGKKKETTIP